MLPRIAIIGTGPTGLYTFKHLIGSTFPLSITLYEAEGEPGKGTPYHPDMNDPAMLSNIPSIELPAFTETLADWLRMLDDNTLMRHGIRREAIDEREFYPRLVLGDYMQAQFAGMLNLAAERGHEIHVLARHKVTDIEIQADAVRLRVSHVDAEEDAVFDHVVMATGHNWPESTEIRPGYFVSPWPASILKSVHNEAVGILGTSLSGIDALMTVATAHGMFYSDAAGDLQYQPAGGTDDFRATLMSRKGLLPEADFYCPLPYATPLVCTKEAVDALIATGRHDLLDDVFELFRGEIVARDPDYAARIGLSQLTVETLAAAYYADRTESDPFVWAARNLAEAEENRQKRYTVPWRYAILITHEIVARVIPHLDETDLKRFHRHFKGVFIDDYATVPLMSIRRLLALSRAGKLSILKLGEDYQIRTAEDGLERGAEVDVDGEAHRFGAFIDATGQETLSATDLPFPTLVAQGGVQEAWTPKASAISQPDRDPDMVRTGGIDVDGSYRPRFGLMSEGRLYCAAIAFLLHKEPFVQGITSARDIGETVGRAILSDIIEEKTPLFQISA